jgi:hypothetical protein
VYHDAEEIARYLNGLPPLSIIHSIWRSFRMRVML